MSGKRTRSPRKSEECKGVVKYQLPCKQHPGRRDEYYIPEELEKTFCKLYEVTMNRDMVKLFGVGASTIYRLAKERNLKKKMKVIWRKNGKRTKKKCEKNGYYDSLKGKAPSQACQEAYKRKIQSPEWKHPMQIVKDKNPWRYKSLCKKRGEKRKKMVKSEKFNVRMGLRQETNLHLPQFKYTKSQICYRSNMMKKGYILGDTREEFGERYTIYYDSETQRATVAEKNAPKYGMKIAPLPDEEQPKKTVKVAVNYDF